jgi:hypothetical protein
MKLIAIPVLMALFGLILVALYIDAPRMADENWQASVPDGDSDRYFSEFERNLTPEARLFDVGLGLASFGASILVLLVGMKVWTLARLRTLQTPRLRWPIVIAANAVWIYYIWATSQFLMVQFRRDEFPWWADSMGIPLAGISVFGIVGGLLMNVGLAFCLYGATLPASMWARPRTARAWALNAGIAFAFLMCAWAGVDAVMLGDAYTPPAVVAAIALLLIGRASASAA